jgi:UDP-2-acetamido-2-deoxy-ribo-hexuluronate aminotransferase
MIYYPIPAHKQKMFAAFNCADQDLPVTDWLTRTSVSLPIHTELEEEQLNLFVNHILKNLLKHE